MQGDQPPVLTYDGVCAINSVEKALQLFTELSLKGADKHAPIRKCTVKARKASWLDEEQKTLLAIKSGDFFYAYA